MGEKEVCCRCPSKRMKAISYHPARQESTTTRLRLFCVSRPRCCNGFFDECLKHLHVHIRELLDVQASLAGGVLAELGEQRPSAIKADRAVQNICGLARRKADDRHIAFAPALVGIVVAVEADDRRSPHGGLVTSNLLHQLGQSLGVYASRLVSARIEKRRNADGCGFGLILGHDYPWCQNPKLTGQILSPVRPRLQ